MRNAIELVEECKKHFTIEIDNEGQIVFYTGLYNDKEIEVGDIITIESIITPSRSNGFRGGK